MKDEIMSLLTDFGELTLDSFLQDGMIKELPIVGSAFSMVKIGADIRDRIFVEKLKCFTPVYNFLIFLNPDKT